MRPGRVHLRVSDLARSVAFYQGTIGFELLDRSGRSAELGCTSADFDSPSEPTGPLLRLTETPGVRPISPRSRLGLYHFALLLPSRGDLGGFLSRQTSLGTRYGAADHRFSEALYLEDPDGLTIEVYRDRPRSEWAEPDGKLPLVSAPLDHAGLMDAADEDGTAWEGVPPGSVVGHVHFYVEDLARAERFYCDGIGFQKTITIPTALFVSDGGYHHHVGVNTWAAGSPRASEKDAGLVDWELIILDESKLRRVVARLESEGFAGLESEEGQVVVRDPWGIAVRLTSESEPRRG